jgi:superfamily I DNA/RNA helicase
LKGARFEYLSSAESETNLKSYAPNVWPNSIHDAIESLAHHRFQFAPAVAAAGFSAEVDMQAIGSGSVTSNMIYDEWKRHLTKSQKDVLDHRIESSIRIIGPAGSGKTLVLCMRATQISRELDVVTKGKRILIATHSWAMAERIDSVLWMLNGGLQPTNITVFPLLFILESHAGFVGQRGASIIGGDSTEGRIKAMEIINEIVQSFDKERRQSLSELIKNGLQGSESSHHRLELIENLYDEISGVVTASGVSLDDHDSIRRYINSDRDDWMPPFFTKEDRGFVISVYKDFVRELIDRSAITANQFVLDSIRVLETYTWRMKRETDGYDYIFVDELQLFDPQERAALELLGRSRTGVPFVTAEDPSQGVFSALNGRKDKNHNELVYLDTTHRLNNGIF